MYRRRRHRLTPLRRRRRRVRRVRRLRVLLSGKGISRPYVNKRNRLMLGSGSSKKTPTQRGGFFPLAAALTAAPAIVDILGKIIKKKMPPRNRIIMIKRDRPKRVTLPNGRSFLARYRRATRDELPANIDFPRVYKQRVAPKGRRRKNRYRERQRATLRRRAQRGRGIGSFLKKGFKLGKRALKSSLGKNLQEQQ